MKTKGKVSVIVLGCLTLIAAIAILLAGLKYTDLTSKLDEWWTYIVGYAFALLVGHLCIAPVISVAWDKVKAKGEIERAGPVFSPVLAFIERALFATAWLIDGAKPFIVAWLAFKVTGQHVKGTPKEAGAANRIETIRAVFTIFLIGNALSLVYAVVGAEMIGWLTNGSWELVTFVLSALLLGTFVIWLWVSLIKDDNKTEQGGTSTKSQEPSPSAK